MQNKQLVNKISVLSVVCGLLLGFGIALMAITHILLGTSSGPFFVSVCIVIASFIIAIKIDKAREQLLKILEEK